MSVALFIQHAKRMRPITSSSVACLTTIIFPHYLINSKIFGKELLNTKCVFRFSVLLSETFLILRRILRHITINRHRFSSKLPVILVKIESSPNFLERFRIILKYQISPKSVHWQPSCSLQTDRHDEVDSCFFAILPTRLRTREAAGTCHIRHKLRN